MEDKKMLRKSMMERLRSMSDGEYMERSNRIASNLFGHPAWKEAEVIGITISRPPEVDTYQIIEKAWQEGKRIAVPKCLPATREMQFRYLTDFSELEKVYYGLLEPIVEKTEQVRPDDISLLVVPGLAFSRDGYRLGFGGGYYDRFLTVYKGQTASLAFSCQIVGELPVENHDRQVGMIMTEEPVFEK
ncbi:5-formyltetrahydrofolate cyclo-ligase [Neobacillus piezotolerans]|uniref:5-formyltetrahydrofolate cyclo-ligase n=1 Tax=Neobacillus piezotolerans TaxID=2259171 RepID=A0A3D8GM66_9BACI|nr:5-formyltetrahydrofolate cyclo-ligase [Neobacillus piezotolerans]RDU35377.1 5-formyltetrahydrofolate cyclo-ligase [Neobacillus piezotolerans]